MAAKKISFLIIVAVTIIFIECINHQRKAEDPMPVKAYNIDYNWGPGGAHGFAAPGLWADANPDTLMKWYEDLGCNVVHSFAVSCNGYAWYKNGIVPEQPGLKYDFLTEMVKTGHKKGIKVFGYFCVGANNKWEEDHPDLCYQMDGQQIPFTRQYINYLSSSIEDAIKKTDMDGIMLDWFYNPGGGRDPLPSLRWIPCEQIMFQELMGRPFPGKDSITPEVELDFRRKAINRAWKQIMETTKKTKPDCIIWLTAYEVNSKEYTNSDMLKEVDWLMNEAGDLAKTDAMRKLVGSQTRLITCLANWNKQNPTDIVPVAIKENIGLYGFTKPVKNWMMLPVDYYLSNSVDKLSGDERNIAVLARAFKNLPLNDVKK
jgi:hypothetical protein